MNRALLRATLAWLMCAAALLPVPAQALSCTPLKVSEYDLVLYGTVHTVETIPGHQRQRATVVPERVHKGAVAASYQLEYQLYPQWGPFLTPGSTYWLYATQEPGPAGSNAPPRFVITACSVTPAPHTPDDTPH